MQSPWWSGDYPVTQDYGCTSFQGEGSSPLHPECPYWHDGIDIGMPCGTVIICQVNGRVRYQGWYGGGPYSLIINAGNWDIWLGHLEASYVSVGQNVYPGLALGLSGTLGFSTGCHLHFQVNHAGGTYHDSVNPLPFLVAGDRAVSGVPSLPYPPDVDSSWKRSGLLDPTGDFRMTRGDITAFFRFLFMLCLYDPKPVPNDPANRWDDQYWADVWLDNVGTMGDGPGQFHTLMLWWADFRQLRPDLTVPLAALTVGPPGKDGAQGPPGKDGASVDLTKLRVIQTG